MCFQYAEDYEFDSDQKEDLWYFIRAMDLEFLQWWQKKRPKPKVPRAK